MSFSRVERNAGFALSCERPTVRADDENDDKDDKVPKRMLLPLLQLCILLPLLPVHRRQLFQGLRGVRGDGVRSEGRIARQCNLRIASHRIASQENRESPPPTSENLPSCSNSLCINCLANLSSSADA